MTAFDIFSISGSMARIMCMVCAVVLSCIALYRDAKGDEAKATNLIAFACFFAIIAK